MKASRKYNKEITHELIERFAEGERLSINEIIVEYLGRPTTDLSRRVYRQRVQSWISAAKRYFKNNKEFLTVVETTPDNEYGLITDEGSARTAFHQYYRLATGIVSSVQLLHKNVQSKKLLPREVRNTPLLLPRIRSDK